MAESQSYYCIEQSNIQVFFTATSSTNSLPTSNIPIILRSNVIIPRLTVLIPQIVEAFQNEQNCYIQELQIMAEKIKAVFDNPKSGLFIKCFSKLVTFQ